MTDLKQNRLAELNQEFALALGESLRLAGASLEGGQAWSDCVPLSSGEASTRLVEALTVALQLRGDLSGEVFLSLTPQAAEALLPPPGAGVPVDVPAAWLEFVKASKGSMEKALELTFGQVTIDACRLAEPAPELLPLPCLTLDDAAAGKRTAISLHTDSPLRSHLERLAAGDHHRAGSRLPGTLPGEGKLGRVIDVPLPVTLRFGQRQLTLRELLALTTGSLVELDRQVEDPVDLVLGERVIARGEVVIVDGNYGMRVLEVVESCEGGLPSSPGTLTSGNGLRGAAGLPL